MDKITSRKLQHRALFIAIAAALLTNNFYLDQFNSGSALLAGISMGRALPNSI